MFVRSGREAPSVVSTRVLRTHRKNSVENFRLNERVKTIDYEIQHNFSQISNEIDGVRQNLVKIKGVKKNVGVSVERRKLLRDKGLRILPFKQNCSDYFTVRTPQGEDINISCSDFYDGETMRTRLSINFNEPAAATPFLEVENCDGEELIDSATAKSRSGRHTIAWETPFCYRNITPPLRPGSRRNFRNVDEENSEDEEKLLKNLSSMERKYGILRPQTACLRERDRQVSPRPRSWTCPAQLQSHEAVTMPQRKLWRKNSGALENKGKKSLVNNSVENETNTTEKTTEQPLLQSDSKQEDCNNNIVLEETFSLSQPVRPRIRPRSMTAAPGQASLGISRTVVGMRRMSLDMDKTDHLPPSSTGARWFQPDTPESTPGGPRRSEVTINEDTEKGERKLSKIAERKVSFMDNVQSNDHSKIMKSRVNHASPISNDPSPDRHRRRESSLSTNSQSSCDVRAQSVLQSRSFNRKASRRSSQDFVYDARPNKALNKGYLTMQMTIGNKQVKVYVPKFSSDCFDDVVERARAKSAVKAVGGIGRPLAGNRR